MVERNWLGSRASLATSRPCSPSCSRRRSCPSRSEISATSLPAKAALITTRSRTSPISSHGIYIVRLFSPTTWSAPSRLLALGQVGLGVLVGAVADRPGGPVDEVQHARLEGLGREQRQRDRGLALVEQPHALADGDRVHQQVQLVQQPGGQQLADDRDRAAQADGPLAGLVLQGGDGLDEVALQLLGVSPGELQRLVRRDDLADVAERLGHLGVLLAGRLPLRPRPGEAVVGLAAEQHDVGRAEGRRDGGPHLVVEVREVPVRWLLDDAVERDEQAGDDLAHDCVSYRLRAAIGANREYWPWKVTVTVSVGPLRCLERIRSASPLRGDSGS